MEDLLGIGVVEGFFGPEWPWLARHHFCKNLRSYGGQFYIYAPKRDSYLRKNWTQNHPAQIWNELKSLSLRCLSENVAFGIGLSPFEIHASWSQQTKQKLRDKIDSLSELNFKYLGLFFDDMKGSEDLADRQIEIIDYVNGITDKTILFCPTYYSHDPLLDKIFGQRSVDYLEKLGRLPVDIQIFWTGSKVIPNAISADELLQVTKILKRKPLIWDNYFANDGPKQCKFLKLKPLEGRTESALKSAAGWAFNLMNQPELSEILFASSVKTLVAGINPQVAFETEMEKIPDSELLRSYSVTFAEQGLDGIDSNVRADLVRMLGPTGASQEVRNWLQGKYLVGDECLTD